MKLRRPHAGPRGAGVWAAAALLLGGACAAPSRSESAAADAPALRLSWRIEPDGGGGDVRLLADGSGTSSAWAGAESPRVENGLSADAARAQAVAAAAARLQGVPRWLHVSGTFAGARLRIERDGTLVHDGSHALARPVAALLDDLRGSDASLAAALEGLRTAPQSRGPHFTFSPGDDPKRLLPPLVEGGGDAELRHLAARIAIAEDARSLVPTLRAAFQRTRDRDGEGDYFVAAALLRLGDPVGLPRVARVLQSSRPEWADEAADDLAACLPEGAFARPAGPDAAAAASARLLRWFEGEGSRLYLPAGASRYVLGDGGPRR